MLIFVQDYWVNIEDGEWKLWSTRVPTVDVESHLVASPDVVIPTVDTVRHEEVLRSWLTEHRYLHSFIATPLILAYS